MVHTKYVIHMSICIHALYTFHYTHALCTFKIYGYEFLCSFMSPTDTENIYSSGRLGFLVFFCPLGNKLVSGVCLNFLWSMLGTGWWSSDPVLCGRTESSLCSITGVSCCQVQGHTSNWIWNQKEFPPKWDWQGKYILGYLENVSCLLWLAKVLMILWFFLCISFEF